MPATFNGDNIFGGQQRQNGPTARTRNQREQLPGVRGYRVYRIVGVGADTRTWVVRGRLVSTTLRSLMSFIANIQDNIGVFGTFIDVGGQRWSNCELVDFRPVSEFRTCLIDGTAYATCEVSGTVEQAGG